jgi:dienelactone hydrolase
MMLTAALLAIVALGTSCSDGSRRPQIQVDRPDATVDTPLQIRLTGLPSREHVVLTLSATDSSGITWTSMAEYVATTEGGIDLSQDAPVAGSYSGTAAMGLFWSMKPQRNAASDTAFMYGPSGFTAQLRAQAGKRTVASVTLHRRAADGDVVKRDLRVSDVGFYGEFYRPAHQDGTAPAVVIVGGSEGGLAVDAIAKLLASRGYPTLALAYFAEPGLPSGIHDIPLEYFALAIGWVRRQGGVDPKRTYMAGISRGAEATLLVASDFPGLLHGAVAAAPTSVVNPPQQGSRGEAWTLRGAPVPAIPSRDFGVPGPVDAQEAVIPVQRFSGPLLLICGTDDEIWPSCGYADAIEAHRSGPSDDVVVKVSAAGHGVASLVPYISEATTGGLGGEPVADGRGRARSWTALLDFLRS